MGRKKNSARAREEEAARQRLSLLIRHRMLRDFGNPFQLTEYEFRRLYRFDRHTALKLLISTSKNIESPHIPIMIRIFSALHYYANGCYQNEFTRILYQRQFENLCIVSKAIEKMSPKHIIFPEVDEYDEIKQVFYEKEAFPGIIGVLCTTHIRIEALQAVPVSPKFINSKGYYSIKLQLICDWDLKILDAVCALGGSQNMATFKQSKVNRLLSSRYENDKQADNWLLADTTFGLSPWVLTPYGEPTANDELHFNKVHKRIATCSTRLVTMLRQNFRCLEKIDASPPTALKIIKACTVLHNMLLDSMEYNTNNSKEPSPEVQRNPSAPTGQVPVVQDCSWDQTEADVRRKKVAANIFAQEVIVIDDDDDVDDDDDELEDVNDESMDDIVVIV